MDQRLRTHTDLTEDSEFNAEYPLSQITIACCSRSKGNNVSVPPGHLHLSEHTHMQNTYIHIIKSNLIKECIFIQSVLFDLEKRKVTIPST